jgi:hypothetical protein
LKPTSLFIVAYFIITALWLWLTAPAELCPPNSFTASLKSRLTFITFLTGLEQSWAFFSPSVNTVNSYHLIALTLQNGLIKLIELPRMEKLSRFEKLQQEKYRKLYNDNMTNSAYAFFRPDIARFVSRANNEPGNPPVRATFFLISEPISPPDIKARKLGAVEKYFVYRVDANDF